ncbi:MAG: PqqD family protein [Pseudomonadota bacterium]
MTLSHAAVPTTVEGHSIVALEGNEYQLVRQSDDHGIFINEQTIIIWQLCDGKRSIAEIIEVLCESYPNAKESIPADVEATIARLLEHQTIVLDK